MYRQCYTFPPDSLNNLLPLTKLSLKSLFSLLVKMIQRSSPTLLGAKAFLTPEGNIPLLFGIEPRPQI